MGRELTDADMEQWSVRYEDGGTEAVRAAYVTTEPPQGSAVQSGQGQSLGFVTFKDWRHKVVAMVPAHLIRNIRRCEPAGD